VWASGDAIVLRFSSIDGRFHSGRPVRIVERTPEPELPLGWDALVETDRLRLVPFDERHAAAAEIVHGTDAAREAAASGEHWREHGFGTWLLVARSSGTAVGVAEVHHAHPGVTGIGEEEVEIGWAIAEGERGRGLATEAMRAALADLWRRSAVEHVVAYIRPENLASHRVAAGLGLEVRGPGLTRSGDPMTVYVLRRRAS